MFTIGKVVAPTMMPRRGERTGVSPLSSYGLAITPIVALAYRIADPLSSA